MANLLYPNHHIFAFSFFQSSKICHPCDFNITFVFEQKGSTDLFGSLGGGREVPGESTRGCCQVSRQGRPEALPYWAAPATVGRTRSQAPERWRGRTPWGPLGRTAGHPHEETTSLLTPEEGSPHSDPEGLRAGRLHQSAPETQAPCTQREGRSALLLRPSPRLQGGTWLVRDPFHWEKESGFRVSETKEFLSLENEQMLPSQGGTVRSLCADTAVKCRCYVHHSLAAPSHPWPTPCHSEMGSFTPAPVHTPATSSTSACPPPQIRFSHVTHPLPSSSFPVFPSFATQPALPSLPPAQRAVGVVLCPTASQSPRGCGELANGLNPPRAWGRA